jgi:catechol 2,3-dioxygenase-like lactoylglutathione lyase family enzyme
VDVLSSRILLRPSDLDRSRRFYRDVLGLAVYREFGPPEDPGMVFFLGPGFLEVSGPAAGAPEGSVMIWIQVRDVRAEHARLAAAGVPVIREPATEPWGLIEMWIEDPDGIRIVLVEVPADHPLRRDPRSASPPNVTDHGSFPAFAGELRCQLRERWATEQFDILINNAGFDGLTPFGQTDAATIDALYAVHVKGSVC